MEKTTECSRSLLADAGGSRGEDVPPAVAIRLVHSNAPARAESTRRLESVATDWEGRLSAARDVWARAGEEVPLRVAEASAQVLRTVLEENRAALRWLLGLAAVLAILSSVACVLSWWTHALLEERTAAATFEATREDSGGSHQH